MKEWMNEWEVSIQFSARASGPVLQCEVQRLVTALSTSLHDSSYFQFKVLLQSCGYPKPDDEMSGAFAMCWMVEAYRVRSGGVT